MTQETFNAPSAQPEVRLDSDAETRAIGATTLEAMQDKRESSLIENIELDLTEWGKTWQMLEEQTYAILTDEDGKEELADLLTLQKADLSIDVVDRKTRREARKETHKLYPEIATVFIYSGRLDEMCKQEVEDNYENDSQLWRRVKEMPGMQYQRGRINSKKDGILANFDDSEPKARFRERMLDCEETSKSHSRDIHKIESRIDRQTWKYIKRNGSQAFLNEVVERAESEAASDQQFVEFFTQKLTEKGENSWLSMALEEVKEQAKHGSMARAYIERLCSDQTSHFAYMQSRFVSKDDGRDFISAMEADFQLWPRDLHDGYMKFISRHHTKLEHQFEQIQEQFATSTETRHLPSLQAYETFIDNVFHEVHPGGYKNDIALDKTQTSMEKVRTLQPDLFDERVHEAEPTPRTLHRAVIKNNRVELGEEMDADEIAKNAANRKGLRKQQFVPDAAKCLNVLAEHTFQDGVTSISEIQPKPMGNNGQTRIYRLNPECLTGVSVSKPMRDARIIFVVSKDKIGVLHIPDSHDRYERIIEHLK